MQELTPDVQKYYFLGCGHALSLCLTLLTDNVRKDFKAKIVHHAATLSLLVFSYVCGYTRVGALVMWLHDGSDFYLEIAKSLVYLKKQFLADIFFTIFALAFFISRIVYFPFVVIHTTLVKPIGLFGLFPGYFIFNALLGTLLCLHLYWFYLICDLAWKLIKGDQIADNRSDNEESSSEDEAKKTK
ncbi:Oidioi.mRNA.OKI2018_I69.chr1.g294.t1.cds [Oikopleura dioica]|uniref:Oidioi.mRNA.OKI2018_I69.chr1.g294.t1.cds n=1 Tax=Oikopleura dioica TaxID=34765 RepID=A0ABN7SL38_OIKDI|nr:Oidioi.mRNA.OKI2018_I69.chr1.g294.t1.cds [Oikopleura dioica]